MTGDNENPLVSFIVIAYQQERYIREAVRSALAQTYEPLEIIISDDCSKDQTYQHMVEEVAAYSGPHKIHLNRNENNIGLVKNLERAASLCNGDFIVVQAGDDISVPERTYLLVAARNKSSLADAVYSDVYIINENGEIKSKGWRNPIVSPTILGAAVLTREFYALGCAAAYSRSLFNQFSPMNHDVYQEDVVLAFRALIGNGVRVVPEMLVGYRMHTNNIFYGKNNKQTKARIVSLIRNQWGIACDRLEAWDESGLPSDERRSALVQQKMYWRYRRAAVESNFIGVMKLAVKGVADGLSLRNAAGLVRLYFSVVLANG